MVRAGDERFEQRGRPRTSSGHLDVNEVSAMYEILLHARAEALTTMAHDFTIWFGLAMYLMFVWIFFFCLFCLFLDESDED